ncbi:MAG TPA: amidohydrolase [Terriglobales bacterium]|nr:amidohydrolase [Terriglobales bacterium]
MRERLLVLPLLLMTLPALAQKAAAPKGSKPAVNRAAAHDQRIAQLVEALRDKTVETRRDLHMHPELSNREERTSQLVAARLRELGMDEVKTGVGRYGVVALLKGGRPGPVVAVRADMDALPVQEVNDTPYKSLNPGVKHACGHDGHVAIGLAVAAVLSEMRAEIPGTVKFIFQPAEEGPPAGEEGGAALMIKEGALENPRPEVIFGLHLWSQYEVGSVFYNFGPALAASDRFQITIRGKQVHAAYPQDGIDPIVTAAEAVLALQTIRSRRVTTMEPLVISVGRIQGGNRNNIIPNQVELEGTVRTMNEEVRKRIPDLMRQTLEGVTRANGATFELEYEFGNPVTYNDPKLVEEMLPALRRAAGAEHVLTRPPQMGAEDFAEFQKVIPGFFFFVAAGNQSKGITAAHHTPDFDIDEDSLAIGARTMATAVVDYLERHAK